MKTYYTYNEILDLKNDVKSMIGLFKQVSPNDVESFERAILEYDTVLNKIGIGGVVTDYDFVRGFNETRTLINSIRANL
jgi:hypothetical protein